MGCTPSFQEKKREKFYLENQNQKNNSEHTQDTITVPKSGSLDSVKSKNQAKKYDSNTTQDDRKGSSSIQYLQENNGEKQQEISLNDINNNENKPTKQESEQLRFLLKIAAKKIPQKKITLNFIQTRKRVKEQRQAKENPAPFITQDIQKSFIMKKRLQLIKDIDSIKKIQDSSKSNNINNTKRLELDSCNYNRNLVHV